MWFFRSDHGQLQRIYLAGPLGEAALPSQDFVYRQCIISRTNTPSPSPPAPQLTMLFHVAAFPAWIPAVGGCFIKDLQQRNSSGASAWTSLSGKEGLLEDHLLHSYSVLRTFPLLVFSSCPQVSGSIKLQDPHVYTDLLVPQLVPLNEETWIRRGVSEHFLLFSFCSYYPSERFKAWLLLSFCLVLISYLGTWQLSFLWSSAQPLVGSSPPTN